jgi:hypothetical protein
MSIDIEENQYIFKFFRYDFSILNIPYIHVIYYSQLYLLNFNLNRGYNFNYHMSFIDLNFIYIIQLHLLKILNL